MCIRDRFRENGNQLKASAQLKGILKMLCGNVSHGQRKMGQMLIKVCHVCLRASAGRSGLSGNGGSSPPAGGVCAAWICAIMIIHADSFLFRSCFRFILWQKRTNGSWAPGRRRQWKLGDGRRRAGQKIGKKIKLGIDFYPQSVILIFVRGIRAAGSAPQWHCGGHGFESRMLQ